MSQRKTKKPTKQKMLMRHRKAYMWTLSLIVLYTISVFVPVIGGYAAYPVAIVKCGKEPVITSDFMASRSYSEPGMISHTGPSWLSSYKNYVCSAQDAENEGYSRAPW